MVIKLTKEQCEQVGLKEGSQIDVNLTEKEDNYDAEYKVIDEMQGDYGSDNDKQIAGLKMMEQLASSNAPISNKFMEQLDKATTKISQGIMAEKKKK